MSFDSFHTPDAEPVNGVVSGMADGSTSAAMTQARSRMRETRTSGSARGAARKGRPYRDPLERLQIDGKCNGFAEYI